MDYRALAELIMLSMIGLSVFVVAAGFSIRMFLAPTLRELFGRKSAPVPENSLLTARLSQLEDRLDSIDATLDRLADAQDFDRQLEGPKTG